MAAQDLPEASHVITANNCESGVVNPAVGEQLFKKRLVIQKPGNYIYHKIKAICLIGRKFGSDNLVDEWY